jgi:hypothetical protein
VKWNFQFHAKSAGRRAAKFEPMIASVQSAQPRPGVSEADSVRRLAKSIWRHSAATVANLNLQAILNTPGFQSDDAALRMPDSMFDRIFNQWLEDKSRN